MVDGRSWLVACLALLAIACGEQPANEDALPGAAGVAPEVDFVQEAVWSPKGDRLIATWNQGTRFRLYGISAPDPSGPVLDPGSGLRVSDGPDMWASWSPDGLWIAFGSSRDGQSEIYRMRPDGTSPERLTNDPADDREPAYSPDGSMIAFVSDRTDGAPRVHLMNADGSEVRMIGNPPGTEHHGPVWSPDGKRIALSVTVDGEDFVYLTTPNGGWGRVREGQYPSWAPNSDHIYYSHGDTVYVIATSTQVRHFLTTPGFAPRVSPDGRMLAYVKGAWPESSLYVLDQETGVEQRVTR
jgi:Tol biopolymer transport system component